MTILAIRRRSNKLHKRGAVSAIGATTGPKGLGKLLSTSLFEGVTRPIVEGSELTIQQKT
jgi:hypothetical protein